MGSETENNFTSGSITLELTKFMLPILGALVLQAMYGAVDILVVGWFGTTPGISGVAVGSNIINFVTFTVTALSMGVTVLIGQYIGCGQQKRIGNLIGGAVCFFLVFTVVVSSLLIVFAGTFSALLQTPTEAVSQTVAYVRVCGGGILFIVFYNLISSIFRGMGNSKLPLLFVAIACVCNIFGDLLFVAVFKMDAVGAALATVMAQAISVGLSLLVIWRVDLPFTINRSNFRFNSEIALFVKIGFPIALQEILTQISFLALNAFINRLGLAASSGSGVSSKITAFIMLIPSSLQQALTAFVAQNVGAGLEKRATDALWTGVATTIWISVVISLLSYFKGDLMASVFTSEPAVIENAASYLKGFSLDPILTTVYFSYVGYFNGHGQTLFVMLQGLAQSFLVRLPVSYIMSIQPGANLAMIGFAAPCATIFAIFLNTAYFIYYKRKLAVKAGESPSDFT